MASGKEKITNVMLTFIIGFFAGVSPFLFMRLLPRMMNPSLYKGSMDYWPLVITGTLIGAIASILFSKTFAEKDPHDIFFYSLGIPAILIATVSNITTEFDAVKKIDQINYRAMESVKDIGILQKKPKMLNLSKNMTPLDKSIFQEFLATKKAWAGEVGEDNYTILAQINKYYVVLGKYNNSNDAKKGYKQYKEKVFGAERYTPKNLQVLELDSNYYILVYSICTSKEEAERVYKALRINDPEINVSILSYSS